MGHTHTHGTHMARASPLAAPAANPFSNYKLEEYRIGEGTYGWVSRYHNTVTGQLVAIKTAKPLTWSKPGETSIFTRREIVIMKEVTHPNVMGFVEVLLVDGVPKIVMPFMDGDLSKVIHDKGLILGESDIKCLSKQLFSGLEALHNKSFMHRDLSARNVLICFQTGQLCIGDFGMSRSMTLQPMTAQVGTRCYRAPELLFGAVRYFSAVDIWSAGVLVAEMFSRKAIFAEDCELATLNKIFERMGSPSETNWPEALRLPDYLRFFNYERLPIQSWLEGISSACAADFVDVILVLDPQKRPYADVLLKTKFFTERPKATKRSMLPFVVRMHGSGSGGRRALTEGGLVVATAAEPPAAPVDDAQLEEDW